MICNEKATRGVATNKGVGKLRVYHTLRFNRLF